MSVEKYTNFAEEANAHNYRNLSAEQHVHWRNQGRNALNFQQAGFERAAQEYEPAGRDEIHVAAAQSMEMSRAEILSRMGLFNIEQSNPGRLIK